MKADDRRIVEAISRGSREAFATLFDSTSGAVRTELAAWLPDAQLAVVVFAATYLEVWWLAGCHSGSQIDVVEWVGQILRRRIADAGGYGGRHPRGGSEAPDPPVERWPSGAPLELAALMGRPVERLWRP